jgi:carboxyl-terminal processing protease
MTSKPTQRLRFTLLSTCVLALQACGGGGGGTSSVASSAATAYSQKANLCVNPRAGIDPRTQESYLDQAGSLAQEKDWVSAFSSDTYLWYSELPTLNANAFATPQDLFASLKTSATTPSGSLKDRFHFAMSSADWYAFSSAGVSVDYGITWSVIAAAPPRNVSVAMLEPTAPSAHQIVTRGMKLLTVDGIDVVNSTSAADVKTINQALFPSTVGESHQFLFQKGLGVYSATLTAQTITTVPVPLTKTINTATGKLGYIQFNDHIASAQTPLVNAFNQLQTAGVNDLVLDLRYNGGGYLDMASQVAYMIAPTVKTNGALFEKVLFNDKNPFASTDVENSVPFFTQTLDYGTGGSGAALPNLGLARVYVLTSSHTASASEAIINSLRGVGVEVILIGSTTTGKPYGFIPQDNCGTTYFTIQFKGVNALGLGDYADGFTPHCAVVDDLSKSMGDSLEKMFAQAQYYRSYGSCNPAYAKPAAAQSVSKTSASLLAIKDSRALTALRMGKNLLRR